MCTLFDFSQALSRLNREGRFAETLRYFRQNKDEFTPEQIRFNKFIVYYVITALIEVNNWDDIFRFIEDYQVTLEPETFSFLLRKVKDKVKRKELSINWTAVSRFCDLINPEQLDTACEIRNLEIRGRGKQMEMASPREEWYALNTKALFETRNYQQCFELSKKALESFEKFHYSNEVWFARRIALSKRYLGNLDEALNELLQVSKKKKEWFIQREIAEIYKEKGEIEEAFKYAIVAVNNSGNIEYKVDLLILIGDLLNARGEQELAFKHYSLSRLLRLEQGWRVPESLTLALSQFSFTQINLTDLPKLKSELKSYWLSLGNAQLENRPPRRPRAEKIRGRIHRILNNNERGADGFLRYGDSESVYFSVKQIEIASRLRVGLEVEFELSLQRNDGRQRAINLRIIE